MAANSDLIADLQSHLQHLHQDPADPINQRLLDTVYYSSLDSVSPDVWQNLSVEIYHLLPILQQDPSPLIRLLGKLLTHIPLTVILGFNPPVNFIAGLDLAARPYNDLTLSIIQKADAASAESLAALQPALFAALIRLWLCVPDEGIADKAGQVLLHLLTIDYEQSLTGGASGPVWKRIFRDKDVYGLTYTICDLNTQDEVATLTRNEKTIAQARLLDILPSIGSLDWTSITQSYLPDVDAKHGLKSGEAGLLDFAAVHMVRYKDDVLLHRNLISFFTNLITKISSPPLGTSSSVSASLEFLLSRGLHQRTARYYLQPDHPDHDPVDQSFLYGPAAHYVATYTSVYSDAFANSPAAIDAVMHRLRSTLDLSSSRWGHSQSPSDDLHVLSSIPRTVLVQLGEQSPHLCLPCKVANADALNTLATLFHGPPSFHDEVVFPPPKISSSRANEKQRRAAEGRAAAELYRSYEARNPRMWADVVTHASTIAMKESAIAAINLIIAVINAEWTGFSDATGSMPVAGSETEHGPDSLLDAILAPSSKASLIPYLLSPPTTFGNLVGGHGDPESAAYKVAVAKFDALNALNKRLKTFQPWRNKGDVNEAEMKRLIMLVDSRMKEGVWGRSPETGGRIGTLGA